MGCKAEVNFHIESEYPPTINHDIEAGHIERLAKTYLGPEMVSNKGLPIAGSEDFSYFL